MKPLAVVFLPEARDGVDADQIVVIAVQHGSRSWAHWLCARLIT